MTSISIAVTRPSRRRCTCFATSSWPAWVPGTDPETGYRFDDTKRCIDQVQGLDEASRYQLFEGNARRVCPRPDRLLARRTSTTTTREIHR